MINSLMIRPRYIAVSILFYTLALYGVTLFPTSINWLSTSVFGMAGLLVLLGWNQVKLLFKPVKRPFFLKFLGLFFLGIFLSFLMSMIGLGIGTIKLNNVSANPLITELGSGDFGQRIILFMQYSVSVVGEEFMMTTITLILLHFLKDKKHGWLIVNLLGCCLFGITHMWTYNFEFWPCLVVGVTRFPLTQALKSGDSIRSAIYVHWASDWISFIPAMFGL